MVLSLVLVWVLSLRRCPVQKSALSDNIEGHCGHHHCHENVRSHGVVVLQLTKFVVPVDI
jgi:hypothetical protein